MSTIVNNPSNGEGMGVGVILGIILALIIIGLFIVYGIPALRGNPPPSNGGVNLQVELPSGDGGGAEAPAN